MRQIFYPYWLWEDYQNGMYADPLDIEKEVIRSSELLAASDCFDKCCGEVVESWPIATAVNLTNANTNRRAWLGQAACCLRHGATERAVRLAWKEITTEDRRRANCIANEWITKYADSSEGLYREVGGHGLFGGNP
tara:strand:- start:221 stop:628 length:408 start_codon:yes stop_codon:yes gene_type:complete